MHEPLASANQTASLKCMEGKEQKFSQKFIGLYFKKKRKNEIVEKEVKFASQARDFQVLISVNESQPN